MINYIWFFMILAGVITAASKGDIQLVTKGVLKGSEQAVVVAAGLIGIISFWSGVMKIAQDAGLMQVLARLLGPLARRLYPEVPPDHPAMGALLAAMACGLQNAMATTFSGAAIRTSHLSGMFTDLGIGIGHALRGLPLQKRRLLLCLLIPIIPGSARCWAYRAMSWPHLSAFSKRNCFPKMSKNG